MVDLINKGWFWLNNGVDYLKLAFIDLLFAWEWEVQFTDYAGDGHYALDLEVQRRIWKPRGIIFDSHTNYDLAVGTIRSWQSTAAFTLEVVRNTSDAKIAFDGTNTSYTVMALGPRRVAKLAAENGDVYEIGTMTFRQAG